ncbi:hemagglutinin repeat-containing protein [Mycoavidus sp. HKI]|uniref:hemagglutinin repeat-containing protein n=1 Tax=Mycoavidus sp. HKI TaxID=2840467 RepID=UPI001CBDBE9D|nr:hemagglutinin repeat-containing protein [Mycoavidus sp. HKI]UAW64321.2 hemagglutinin repeat-containing protein [Mycoavidus sp. HKI]
MLKPINGVSIQHIRSASIAPNRQEPITPHSSEEADSPTVNTAQPNAAGISYNEHPNFNVDPPGVTLQNGSTVRIILNHVIGRTLSQLNSVIKIAGEPAQLVFSNANGIECWGCNFLNTKHLVLSTGEPILNSDGELQAFHVKAGQITIKSNTTLKQFEQIDLIAYSIKVEGELSANKINMSTGTHEINYADTGLPMITRQQELSIARSETDQGSRRASRLHFIETARVWAKEHLNIQADTLDNASHRIQPNGNLTVKAVSLTGAGTLSAALDLAAKLEEDYTHKNQLSAGRHLSISTTQRLINQGTLQIQGEITLEAKELENQSKSLIDGVYLTLKAGDLLRNYGVIRGGSIAIDAPSLVNDGTNHSAEHQAGAILAHRQLTIQAQSLRNQEHGLVRSDGELTIGDALGTQRKLTDSTQVLVNSGSSMIESKEKLSIQVGELNNQNGQITAHSDLILNSQVILNQEGRIKAQGDQSVLDVYTAAINNTSGWLLHTGTGQTQIVAQVTIANFNTKAIPGAGLIFGKGPVTIHSPKIVNYEGGAIISDQMLKIKTPYLGNQLSTLSAGQKIEIDTDKLQNVGGLITVGEDEKFKAEASHSVQGPSRHAPDLVGVLEVNAQEVINTAYTGEKAQESLIRVQGKVVIEAQKIYNANKSQILGKEVDLNSKELISNAASTVYASDKFSLKAHSLVNLDKGILQSEGDFHISVNDELGNLKGQIIANSDLVLKSQVLDNQEVHIETRGDQSVLDVQVNLINNASGRLLNTSAGQTQIVARQTILNRNMDAVKGRGFIFGKGPVSVTSSQIVNDKGGVIFSNQTLEIKAADYVYNKFATLSACQKIDINTSSLNNYAGGLISVGTEEAAKTATSTGAHSPDNLTHYAGVLTVQAKEVRNMLDKGETQGGLIRLQGKIEMEAEKIFNGNKSQILAKNVSLNAKELFFDAGSTVFASDTLDLMAYIFKIKGVVQAQSIHLLSGVSQVCDTEASSWKGTVSTQPPDKEAQPSQSGLTVFQQAKMYASGNLSISSSGSLLNQGELKIEGDISLKARSLENQASALIDGRFLTLILHDQLRNDGVIQGSTVVISAQSLVNDGSEDTDAHQAGAIMARRQLAIGAQTLHNQEHGLVHSDGELTIGGSLNAQHKVEGSAQTLNNTTSATIESRDKLLIQADHLDNQNGQITTSADLILRSKNLDNTQGHIEANGDQSVLDIQVNMIDNTAGRLLHTGTGQAQIVAHYAIMNGDDEGEKGAGLIFAQGLLSVTSPKIANIEGGKILSNQALKIKASSFLSNQAGTLSASQKIEIDTIGLNNLKGKIIVGSDEAHPSQPTHNANLLEVHAKKVLNHDEGQIINTGIGEIKIFSDTIKNGESIDPETQGGLISAQGGVMLEAQGIFNGANSQISGKNVNLQAEQSFANLNGTVSASDRLSLKSKNFLNCIEGVLQSDGDLYVSVDRLINDGILHGKGQVLIEGDQIENNKQGWNDNYKTMQPPQRHVLKPGSALIVGDTVSIGAHDRLNSMLLNMAGVIFAQNSLKIGVKEVQNLERGVLYSGGSLAIGGELDAQSTAQVSSERILNNGSTIDAVGDLSIHAKKLINQNSRFETQERLIEEREIHECQDQHTNQRYDGSQIGWHGDVGGLYRVHHSGTEVFCFTNYNFTRRVSTTVVTHSEPGKIQAGGAIRLSGAVFNDKSRIIAGGALSDLEGGVAQINNRDANGRRITTDQGTSQWSDRDWHGGMFSRGWTRDWSGHVPYHPAPVIEHHTLNVAVSQQYTAVDQQAPSTALVLSTSALTRSSPFLNSGLQHFQFDPDRAYLIQTDPRFTRNSDTVSSNFLLNLLNLDPQHVPKRLGDGFYEQQLIRDQIIGLTGHYYLSGYRNPIAEFKALMHRGANWAKQHHLTLGIEPTPQQIAALSASPVWLVNQSVKLPDGSEQTVLTPKVYLAKRDASPVPLGGSLISANAIELHSDRPFKNAGTMISRGKMALTARNIDNQRGAIVSLDTLSMQASHNIDSRAGQLIAVKKMTLKAGQDIHLQSQTHTTHAISGSQTALDGVTRVQAEQLDAYAESDIHLASTQIKVAENARLEAKGDLTLGTATVGAQHQLVWDEHNDLSLSRKTEIGTQIETGGSLELKAGRDIHAAGAYVNAGKGLSVKADRDINVEAAYEETDFEESHYRESSTAFSSSSELTQNKLYRKQALSSTLSGGTVQIEAGHDLNIMGSNVIGMHDVDLHAANNIKQKAVEQAERGQHYSVKERSGLLDSGKFGVTVGTRTQKDAQENEHTPQIGSVIGSVSGHVRAFAGHEYEQSGSQLVVPIGDIQIQAGKAKIDVAYEESRVWQRSEWQQSGLTVSVSAPVLAAAQTNQQMLQASTQVSDPRMQALAAGAGALAMKNAYDAIQADPKAVGGATVSAMIGEDRYETEQTQLSKTALNSTLAAGGNISIQVSGLGEESTLDLIGARIEAKQDITLNVEGRLNVEAAPNSLIEQSQQQSRSFAVGMATTLGRQNSVGASLAVSVGHGHADGAQISYTPTLIQAGGKLTLKAQSDVRLKGAQIAGEQVTAQIEGDLEIESVQNTATYHSHSQSISGSVTAGSVSAASLHFSQRRMDSHYLSVAEQAGIQAGEGGFQVTVKGDTKLVGGVIAGAEQAVRAGRNTLMTGTLQQTDLTNQASYDASSISLGGGYSQSGKGVGSKQSGEVTTPAHSGNQLASRGGMSAAIPIVMSASGQAQSTTRSAISGAEIVITDEARQMELTGHSAAETIADLNRHPAQSHQTLAPIFNRAEIEASFDIVNALGREAGTFIVNRAREADHKLERAKNIETLANDEFMPVAQRQELLEVAAELRAQAQNLNKQWGAGGTYRRIVTALTAAASGNVTGTSAQFTQAAALNYLQSLGAEKIKYIADSLHDETVRAALHGALAYGGAVARGQSGGAAALGASASVLVNTLLGPVEGVSEEEKDARKNIVTSLVAGLADAGGVDATSAQHAAQIETENNAMVLAAPLLVTPPGLTLLGLLGAAAAGAVVTKGAMDFYEEYKERATNTEQPGEDGNQLVQPPPPPMITLIEPEQPPHLPGMAWHQDEEVRLEGMPNQSGEHIVQPLARPREVQSAGNVMETPIAEGLDIFDTVIFSKGVKANRDKDYVPNAGSVDNMEHFFNGTEFGKEVKRVTIPTNEFYHGERIYKATEGIGVEIKDGDLMYLDKQHKNHLEVYTGNRVSRNVLNLDGTINVVKTNKAQGRRLVK